jgi:nucleoside-diphosphate-sugar epimerase
MKILVTGGCGYIGTNLVKMLISIGHEVTVLDKFWFGNKLKKDKNLKIIKLNVNDIEKINLKNFNTIVHLANIANDPAAELDPKLTWETNVLYTKKLIEHAIKHKVKKFIFASSGSVYGIKKEKKVTENLKLLPITDYNKSKMIAERVIMSYSNEIKIFCIRPATVCGYSENMRLDVAVNLLTFQALYKKKIKILGGNQIRPNIHVLDLCRVFVLFVDKNCKPGCYNAGFENLKIIDIARKIREKIPSKMTIIKKTNDPRSYRQDSTKLLNLGFRPKYSVEYAINELHELYKSKKLKNLKNYYRVSFMKENPNLFKS